MLWEATPSAPAQYQGEVFSLRDAYLQISSYQKPRPPIHVGAIRKKARELAGEVADGWIAMSTESPETLREKVQEIQMGRARRGTERSVGDFDVVMTGYTDISDDPEKAYRSVEGATKGGLVWERESLQKRTGINVPEELSVQKMDVTNKRVIQEMNELMASIPREVVEEISLTGRNAEECIGKIEKFLDAGVTSVIICNLAQDQAKVFEVYAKEVFPYLRENYGLAGRK
jgi:alkanesulfonate monooxygenase SsuD/methylene tetrahydromethanopterin reductase-like flavin-dependent oxidoreductase (luciferase family)